jgi:hypothetical protein
VENIESYKYHPTLANRQIPHGTVFWKIPAHPVGTTSTWQFDDFGGCQDLEHQERGKTKWW